MNTMTLTKITAGICGPLLVFMLGKWAVDEIYHMEDYKKQAYAIEVESDGDGQETAEVDFASILAAADPKAGAKVFRQCTACHKLEDGANAAGPHLYQVVGRDVGTVDGFGGYSGVLPTVADTWTPENLNAFLESPRSYAKGTSMGYNGLKKIKDRANLIAYLQALTN